MQNRKLKDGEINCYWVQVNNNMQAAPNMMEEGLPGYRNPENFIVVSDAYPTVTAEAADLVLPTAMWVEKEGAYGNAERRTQFWHQLVDAPEGAMSDLWQLVEFSKRFTTDEVWPPELLGRTIPITRERRCTRFCSKTATSTPSPTASGRKTTKTANPTSSASTSRKACSRNTPSSAADTATTWRISTPTTRCAGSVGPWWTARKPAGATTANTTHM